MESFVAMSKYAGMREDLVQAGGGNSAFKIARHRMAIKASGCQLADVTEKNGYAIVDPQMIRDAFLACGNIDEMTEDESKKILSSAFIEGEKPSIETFLHSISGKYSLHTHPIVVNALTCRKNGEEAIKNLFPDALIVPYATPGIGLAKAYFKSYRKYKEKHDAEPRYTFLMNHGFMTSADLAEEAIRMTEYVTKRIEHFLGVDYSGYHIIDEILSLYGTGIVWKVTDSNVIKAYKEIHDAWDHCFCPDCVVFLGKKIYEIKEDKIRYPDFNSFVENNGYPSVIAYHGHLYIHADSVKKALETQSMLSFSAQVMLINKDEECEMLNDDEKNFLLDWDAEKYRKNIK